MGTVVKRGRKLCEKALWSRRSNEMKKCEAREHSNLIMGYNFLSSIKDNNRRAFVRLSGYEIRNANFTMRVNREVFEVYKLYLLEVKPKKSILLSISPPDIIY